MFLVCLGIFFARILDVSLGTIRMVYTVKGKTRIAATVAFFEVLIWFIVARQALNTAEDSLFIAVSYAGGYAMGTLIGSILSNTFIGGLVCVQAILAKENDTLLAKLRKKGYAVSIVALENDYDAVAKEMFIIETNKKNLKELSKLIKDFDPKAFIMVNETKIVQNGLIK